MDEKNKKDRMEELENVIHAIILVYENCVPMVAGFYPCEAALWFLVSHVVQWQNPEQSGDGSSILPVRATRHLQAS